MRKQDNYKDINMQKETYDVVVVGAGVVGCSVSYHLAKSGLKVALVDKGSAAGEASQAAAGMLAPLGDEAPNQEHPLQQLGMEALGYYDGLDEQLKQETGIDIGLVDVPTLRPAFDEQGVAHLQALLTRQQHFLPGLQWLDGSLVHEIEPLLPETVQGALLSPYERSVQAARITLAYARGAAIRGAHLVEGCPVGRLIRQGQRVVGVETVHGPMNAGVIVLAAGAWATQWHTRTSTPPIFPVKGQMIALQAPPSLHLRHTVYAYGVGGIVPKSDGTIFVGSTVEQAGFDKAVTAGGIATLLAAVAKLTPDLNRARFVRAWAGCVQVRQMGCRSLGQARACKDYGLQGDTSAMGFYWGHSQAIFWQNSFRNTQHHLAWIYKHLILTALVAGIVLHP